MASSDISRDGQRPEPGRRSRAQAPAPSGKELADRTVELTKHLGSSDPVLRDAQALPLLLSWVGAGAHDHVLAALGDGMCDGLRSGAMAGQGRAPSTADGPANALRRAASAQVLAAVVRRDNVQLLLHPETVLDWADSVFAWIIREEVLSHGAVGHGADALAAFAASRHFDALALTVLLDVVADRLLVPVRLSPDELDLLARAVASALARRALEGRVIDPWVHRIADAAPRTRSELPARQNAREFLRALHLRLALGAERFDRRADVLLTLATAVRSSSPALFEA